MCFCVCVYNSVVLVGCCCFLEGEGMGGGGGLVFTSFTLEPQSKSLLKEAVRNNNTDW